MTYQQAGFFFVLSSALLASGCTALGVKPWQRDVMAREEMQLDADPLDWAHAPAASASANPDRTANLNPMRSVDFII